MTLCYIAPAHCVRLRKGARKLRRQCDFATGLWSARAAHRGALLGALALLFFVLPARAQISPGPLSRAHQPLSGALQCTSCHKIAGQATFKCLDCHTEIASRLGQGRGYHAAVVNKAEGSQDCVRCHSEHNGENFALIRWEPTLAAFDHSKTGYPLEGKHAGLTCNKCHSAGHIAATEQASLKMKDLNRTFLGVARDCTTCHRDEHLGRLGPNCLACHTYNDWKTVPKFDHSRTRYPLTGAHVPVACQKCHLPGPDGKPRYAAVAFDRCNACHTDPHKGSMAGSCQACHNTGNWKVVSATALVEKFDHSRTKYPLLGKHLELRCDQCHISGDFKKPIEFARCSDCHRSDPHSGQFAKRPDGGECSSCHTVEGWKPSRFGVPEHARSAYPLQGKHTAVDCARCHIPAGRATLYKVKFAQCTDCHKDIHQGQFAAAPYLTRCENCHSVQGFRPSSFTLAKHKSTRYPLVDAHLAVACGDCHKEKETPTGKIVPYRFPDRSCTACHQDPHHGQFAQRMQQRRTGGSALGCEACHTITTWRDLSRFDHATTRFTLVGAHRAVTCIACHRPPNLETRLMNVDFKAVPSACEGCHQDIHAAQFADPDKITRCAGCHNATKWKPVAFDHDRRTTFPLQGAHKDVRCAKCHTLTRVVEGVPVVFYKGTPRECAACHGPDIKPLK